MLNKESTVKQMRIDKFIGSCANYSRKEIKILAKNGQVRVNGEIVSDTSVNINPEKDEITLKGVKIINKQYVYLMMNKPAGVLTATEDCRGKETFADYIGEDYGFYNVTAAGRLDIDAEGFLLLTNDGAFVHEIITPNRHVEKKYFCRISGNMCRNAQEKFEKGIKLDDGFVCMPGKIDITGGDGEITEAVVTVCEGHFHQVKKMVAACGGKVEYLKRISIGGVGLDENLKTGEYRELTKEELSKLGR